MKAAGAQWRSCRGTASPKRRLRVTCLPFSHQVAILHFRALEPDMGAGLHHGSLDDAHEAAVHLPHLLSDKGARAAKASSRKPPGPPRHGPQPLTP